MHHNGLVRRHEDGKTHIYFPLADKKETQNLLPGKMMHTLFNGYAGLLVMQLLGKHKPSH